jgi:hypothetical protein
LMYGSDDRLSGLLKVERSVGLQGGGVEGRKSRGGGRLRRVSVGKGRTTTVDGRRRGCVVAWSAMCSTSLRCQGTFRVDRSVSLAHTNTDESRERPTALLDRFPLSCPPSRVSLTFSFLSRLRIPPPSLFAHFDTRDGC